MFAKKSITLTSYEGVSEISKGERNEPKKCPDQLPARTQLPKNAYGCRRLAVSRPFDPKDHGIEVRDIGSRQQRLRGLTLERRELDPPLAIPLEDKIDRLVAKSTHAIIEQDSAHTFGLTKLKS
jgi:hypothetical protein